MNEITKYRTELMGIAILWVIIFHYGFPIPVIGGIALLGYGGVDIFMFLSGFGLYFSLSKAEAKAGFNSQTVYQFYTRRFIRILPAYFIVVIIALLFRGDFNLTNLILYPTGLGYYLCHTPLIRYVDVTYYDWYIPTLFGFYLVFPALYRAITKRPLLCLGAVFTISILILAVFDILGYMSYRDYQIGVARMTIFTLGAIVGYYLHQGIDLDRYSKPLVIIGLITLVIEYFFNRFLGYHELWGWGLYWLPFILITPGLCIMLTRCIGWLKEHHPKCNMLLYYSGVISLELYLIHAGLLSPWKGLIYDLIPDNYILYNIVGFASFMVVSYVLAYLLHKIISKITPRIKKRYKIG